MPRIFDNINDSLLPALSQTLAVSDHADFCVGYFNLRGWKQIDEHIERMTGGEGHCCRLLVGMQRLPKDDLREAMRLDQQDGNMDMALTVRLRRQLAEEFREQLTIGVPNAADEVGLRRLSAQIKSHKVVVKLHLRHPLHAKLYLLFRNDYNNPRTGYLGSSNLTFSGLSGQGELNVDVLDTDSTKKLADWFNDRWHDRWCIDISDELAQIIDESWAREIPIPPYHIYVKMAYHLSQEAREGLSQFSIPADMRTALFDFQKAAVQIAAHHVNKRGGVLIGDVVGLGKTMMATAVARVFEDDLGFETLIICPKNLVNMWEDYRDRFRLHAKVISVTRVTKDLKDLRRYRLVLIDESHNLRNREGIRYKAIQDYIQKNECRCILLSATPYNKTYLDLSSQLRLFVPEDKNLGLRPEHLLRQMGEANFVAQHQAGLNTLAAFEKSEFADDWRELLRLYMVRRTRGFIKENYAKIDTLTGRKYLVMPDGTHSFFPERQPLALKFAIQDDDPNDRYARLYANEVVEALNGLALPRYGLGNFIVNRPSVPPTAIEKKVLEDLSRGGKRLMGFCRTNLFKRLESSGKAFLMSLERHILRNYVFLYAIDHDKPLPIGNQGSEMLDSRVSDEDSDAISSVLDLDIDVNTLDPNFAGVLDEPELEELASLTETIQPNIAHSEQVYKQRASDVYALYETQYKRRFKWIRANLFNKKLAKDLRNDAHALLGVLQRSGEWQPEQDRKLAALEELLRVKHPHDKVLVFTQFADTANYLATELKRGGITQLAVATGDSDDPTLLAWQFSPRSNAKRNQVSPDQELRILITTDVLSEGQNLQDAFVVVNFDLPWAIIRLIQRAGRVDRIGQTAERILCYTFLPADGVERLIRLRSRIRDRLRQNAEVVGTDESFFEDEVTHIHNDLDMANLYSERAGILDGEADNEVDLASYAYQIWKNATDADPRLAHHIRGLQPVVYSTKSSQGMVLPTQTNEASVSADGVLTYMRMAQGNDALAWIDAQGQTVTESQFAVLQAAACAPTTPALPHQHNHHALVRIAAEQLALEDRSSGGGLGRPSGARFKTYTRLQRFVAGLQGTLFENSDMANEVKKAIDEIYRFPLRESAAEALNRQIRSSASDEQLADLVIQLRQEGRLCISDDIDPDQSHEPQIICSLGIRTE